MSSSRLQKRWLLAFGVLAIASAISSAPRLVIPETNFNFGFVPQNAKVSHVFWLHSMGEDTLQILKVIPGCGCTQAPLERTTLSPGDSTRLEVIFDTKHYTGNVAKRPRIESNEGPPEKSVEFNCNVLARPDSSYPVIVKPYKLDISQFGQKVRDRITFTISNVSDKWISVKLVSAPENITVNLPKTIAAGETGEGSVTLFWVALKTEFEKSITIELDDPAASRFTIPVKRALRLPGDTSAAATVQSGRQIDTK